MTRRGLITPPHAPTPPPLTRGSAQPGRRSRTFRTLLTRGTSKREALLCRPEPTDVPGRCEAAQERTRKPTAKAGAWTPGGIGVFSVEGPELSKAVTSFVFERAQLRSEKQNKTSKKKGGKCLLRLESPRHSRRGYRNTEYSRSGSGARFRTRPHGFLKLRTDFTSRSAGGAALILPSRGSQTQ